MLASGKHPISLENMSCEKRRQLSEAEATLKLENRTQN